MKTADEISTEIANQHYGAIERELVRRVEILIGRVPTDNEVAVHGYRKVFPDKQQFYWKGTLLFTATNPKFETVDGRLTCNFQIT